MLPLWTGSPFLLILLAISVMPNFFPKIWHKIESFFLAICILFTYFILSHFVGDIKAWNIIRHVIEAEYIPFLVIIYTLYTIGTGLKIQISGKPTPVYNALFLFIGGALSNLIGTTGASMLLIHPFLRWNRHQACQKHLVIFFIFIVSNIGGSLTPLGDAPLFVGYIQGIPFAWPLVNLWKPWLVGVLLLLSVFVAIDFWLNKHESYKREALIVSIEGKAQLIFIPLVLLTLIFVKSEMIPFLRELTLLLIASASYLIDKKYNNFLSKKAHWSPVLEVARVFLAIFISMVPISLMLSAGPSGAFADVLSLTNVNGIPQPNMYFWLSGFFSAFLDNAPTYLLFYKMMDADAAEILLSFNQTLIAISLGSVFFGAMTYIGNAPNFMMLNIAKQHGVKMPSFFGFMLWSVLCLLPILFILDVLFVKG